MTKKSQQSNSTTRSRKKVFMYEISVYVSVSESHAKSVDSFVNRTIAVGLGRCSILISFTLVM